MFSLPACWRAALQTPTTRKIVLCTINFSGIDPLRTPHFATQPNSYRLATGAVVVESFATRLHYPFSPYLAEYPEVVEAFSQHERRYEIGQTSLVISGAAELNRLFDKYTFGITARLDLFIPCTRYLEFAQMLMAGRLVSPRFDRATATLRVDLIDEGADVDVKFPAEPYSAADFSDAPDWVLNKRYPQTIVGPFPDDVGADPINQLDDGTSTEFALSYPPVTEDPPVVKVDGSEALGYEIEPLVTPTGKEFSIIRFETPVGKNSVVTCSGGVGRTETNPIKFLLDYARKALSAEDGGLSPLSRSFELTPEAEHLLSNFTAQDFSVIWNASGTVREIIENLLLQTNLVPGFRHGQLDLVQLLQKAPIAYLGHRQGLLFRLPNVQRNDRFVYNSIEVLCGRNFASGGSLFRVVRSPDSSQTSPSMRSMLAASRARYGTRPVQVEALDLAVEKDDLGAPTGCIAGEFLADLLAVVHSFVPIPHPYFADWYTALTLTVNQIAYLTHAEEGLLNTKTRVSGRSLSATGPFVTFEYHKGESALVA